MEQFNEDEGIMGYIRRVSTQEKENHNILGVPNNLFGNINKLRPSGGAGITITGNAEFIEKFLKYLPNDNEKN